jgi:predicted RNase H-like nuclease (RuvC/YqgF family)
MSDINEDILQKKVLKASDKMIANLEEQIKNLQGIIDDQKKIITLYEEKERVWISKLEGMNALQK